MEELKINRFIEKEHDYNSSCITFTRDTNKKLQMQFCGNLDLYISLINGKDDQTFLIGKDNYEVYEIFDNLYNNIMNGNIFDEEEIDKDFKERAMKDAIDTGLIDGEDIIWRSDDFSEDVAPYFKISKLENAYQVMFDVPKIDRKLSGMEEFLIPDKEYGRISVRITNSGSRHHMYNASFMNAYNKLLKMPLDYHQIHIEEYLIDKNIKEEKTLIKTNNK